MSTLTTPAAGTESPRPGRAGRIPPLVRIAVRQYWIPLLVAALLLARPAATVIYHYGGWADAETLRAHVGAKAYHWGTYIDGAYNKTAKLMSDGSEIAFRPALYAALLSGVLTAREWESRRVVLALTQSISPRRWFTVRWATLAAALVVLVTPAVAAFRVSAAHAFDLNLLTFGAERQNAYFTIGPVTVAYVVLGVAAGALTGTLLRRTWATLIAAPALTWLAACLLVRSRAVILADPWIFSEVHGFHMGGVLGLMFWDALPQDAYLTNSLTPGDYWGYQIAYSILVLALAALLVHAALRALRRRVA
ncbi:hypothetical protein [Streptomyces mangrovisoli]|uniref:ABC transporter permease n=1 Tax=Streptomyces mangrovisoli TaxID=1428628 RepID=A0A1J4NWJ4_9ACTN|nr:hypothetical protein [Streptomyces mangrovisoli]OIJ66458.1 hypothetical protein WN71_018270 [Streptomyces mangrovisoli]